MLFGNTKIIIYLGLKKLVIADCRHVVPIFFEIPTTEGLTKAFTKVFKHLPSSSYKIILGKDISYTLTLAKASENIDRLQVKEELSKHIPEDFDNTQFDWKITADNQIEAIVITGDIYHELCNIRTKYPSIRLETQSATSLLLEMGETETKEEISPELFQFAAQKGREHGKDDSVLNVTINTPQKPSGKKPALILGLLFIILGCIGTWVWLNNQTQSTGTTPIPVEVAAPAPTPKPQKLPADYIILVQNGTKKSGLASSYKTKLLELGFEQTQIGNAKVTSTITSIKSAEALPDAIQTSLVKALEPLLPEITIESFDTSTSSSDIVIILGAK